MNMKGWIGAMESCFGRKRFQLPNGQAIKFCHKSLKDKRKAFSYKIVYFFGTQFWFCKSIHLNINLYSKYEHVAGNYQEKKKQIKLNTTVFYLPKIFCSCFTRNLHPYVC